MNLTKLLIGLEFGDGGGRGGVDGVPYVETNRLPSHASVFSFLLCYLISLTKT